MIVRTYEEDEFQVHKLPLIGMAAVVLITVAMTMGVSFGYFDRQAIPEDIRALEGVQAIDSRTIKFADTADGSVLVTDGATGEELALYPQNSGGFVRATARALIYARQVRGIGPEVPFDLVSYDNGSMMLRDSQTGQTVELASFGSRTNEVYEDILREGRE